MPTTTATGTATATATPSTTATLLPVAPTLTATAEPTPTPARPAQAGLITRFDDLSGWKRIRQSNGALTQSTTYLHGNSAYSAALSYRFAPGSDYIIFEKLIPLGGHPTQITAWVYGDGSGVFLSCWVSDIDQEVWQFSFGQVKHTGWRKMAAVLDPGLTTGANHQVAGEADATMDYPIDFSALVIDHAPGSSSGSGEIYLSDLTAAETVSLVQPTATLVQTPVGPAQTPVGPNRTATAPAATRLATAVAKPTSPTARPTAKPTPAPVATPTAIPATAASGVAALQGHLAFVVFKPGMSKATYDLYLSKIDGSESRLVRGWARQPKFRRWDGRLVFNGDGQGKDNLWSMNLDGSDAREVSIHPEDAHPNWSPKGDRLLFDSEFYTWGASAAQRVWTIWTNDTDQKGIEPKSVQVAGGAIRGQSPVWLDNDWIVYTGCNTWAGGGSCGLYTLPSWGGDTARQLTTGGGQDVAADSFGDRILFSSHADGNWEVNAINFDGSGRLNLSANPANDALPTFSPDGRHIAFVSDRSGAWAIWVMNPDGSGQARLFDLPGPLGPDWITERISWGP
jgi:hypothetical protein